MGCAKKEMVSYAWSTRPPRGTSRPAWSGSQRRYRPLRDRSHAENGGVRRRSGGIDDHGFNQLGYAGTRAGAARFHFSVRVLRSSSFTRYLRDLTTAAQGAQLVVASDPQLADPARLVAPQYPRVRFITIDAASSAPNVLGNTFGTAQAAYLAGILAAGVSKTHTIGFVGGFNEPLTNGLLAAYKAGARSYDRGVRLRIAYTNSFGDRSLGMAVGSQEIRQGADVLYPAAGQAGIGTLAAAARRHVYGIGSDIDQNYLYPRAVLTSVLKRVDVAVGAGIRSAATGRFRGGATVWTLANDGVGLAPYHGLARAVPARVQAAIDRARQGIVAGTVRILST